MSKRDNFLLIIPKYFYWLKCGQDNFSDALSLVAGNSLMTYE